MKRVILIIACFGFLTLHLSAQSKKEKITELLALMNSDKTVNAMVDNMTRMFPAKASNTNDIRKDSIYKAYVKEEMIAYSKKMYGKDMVDIYDKNFSIEEIQKYIDFYRTPEGQKFLSAMPGIQKDIMANMMTKDMPELQAKFKKKLEELQN